MSHRPVGCLGMSHRLLECLEFRDITVLKSVVFAWKFRASFLSASNSQTSGQETQCFLDFKGLKRLGFFKRLPFSSPRRDGHWPLKPVAKKGERSGGPSSTRSRPRPEIPFSADARVLDPIKLDVQRPQHMRAGDGFMFKWS